MKNRHNNIKTNSYLSVSVYVSGEMYADVTKNYGCIDCGYFTNIKGNIAKHNKTKRHLEKKQPKKIEPDLDVDCKYQCQVCFKKYKSQSSLWSHRQKCKINEKKEMKSDIGILQDQMASMNVLIQEMMKTQQSTFIITNNQTNNYTTNIHLFLNEKCQNAMGMREFIQGIQFSPENITCSNLLQCNALEHTVDIFRKHLDKIDIHDRPLHNFIDEDKNQIIAHYRDNNEWKTQSELNMLNEIHCDETKDKKKNTLVSYLEMFHKRRLHFFQTNNVNSDRLVANLKHTTYPEQQMNLVKKILEITKVDLSKF